MNINDLELVINNPILIQLFDRLRGITGFISILGDDPRLEVFKRSYHVMRVAKVAEWLCEQNRKYDMNEALFVAYFHDINRLPFAHNLEKQIGFNQANNLEEFFTYFHVDIPKGIIDAIKAALNRDNNGPQAGRLVYAADSVTGFIEDPLLAITTLNVPVQFIPSNVLSFLGFDIDKEFLGKIIRFKNMFNNNPDEFVTNFNGLIFNYAVSFLNRHGTNSKLYTELPTFGEMRALLKEHFLRKRVYPINNELVSHGSKLANEVAIPYMQVLAKKGIDPIMRLLQMTDQELLSAAFNENVIDDPSKYYPTLCITNDERIS